MALFASGCGGVVDSAAHAWKKGTINQNSISAGFGIHDIYAGDELTCGATLTFLSSDDGLVWEPQTLFDKIAIPTSGGPKLKFASSHMFKPDDNTVYDLLREMDDGVFGELRGYWWTDTQDNGNCVIWFAGFTPDQTELYTIELSALSTEFTGFVISDDSSAYPDNAEQNGFFFKKVKIEDSVAHVWRKCVDGNLTFSPQPSVKTWLCNDYAVFRTGEDSEYRVYIPVEYITGDNYKDILNGMSMLFSEYTLQLVKVEYDSGISLLMWETHRITDGSVISTNTTSWDDNNKVLELYSFSSEGIYSNAEFSKYDTVTIPGKVTQEYVVSDDEGAYPDGGYMDGYYYEKINM